jgi:CelD/BcsL family acetyltransferase involved in cellulose biosynthesis
MSFLLDTAATGRQALSGAAATHSVEVRVHTDFAAAEAEWRALEADAVFSPYQRFDWVREFQATLGAGTTPCLAVLADRSGRAQALLPLAIGRRHGLGMAGFIGGKHANYGLGLWRRDFAAACTPAMLRAALRAIARKAERPIDLFALTSQPTVWRGLGNPLARLRHLEAPAPGYFLALDPDPEATLAAALSASSRRKLRRKEKALGELGPVAFVQATTDEDVTSFVDHFLAFKAERLRAQGIANAFAVPGARDFLIEGGKSGLAAGRPVIELCALTIDGRPVAIFGGTVAGGRYSGMFTAMASGPEAHDSPGEVLLTRLIRQCCERGLTVFDLGAGDAAYKQRFCDGRDRLFHQFIPVTWRGMAGAAALTAATTLHRSLKRSDRLWPLVLDLRRRAGQLRG